MKIFTLTVSLLLLGAFTMAMAASVDEQIAAIRKADSQQRVKLVNAFKTTLSTLSQEQRSAAISELRATMKQGGSPELNAREQPQIREQNRISQTHQNGAMQRVQPSNQGGAKNLQRR
jgi:hypothetical protein